MFMTRGEFLRELEYLLKDIPESDRADAIAYYNNYFDEAGIENEQKVIQELGSPEKVAKTMGVKSDTAKKKTHWIIIILIAVLTFPLWVGIVAGLFGGLVALLAGVFGVTVGIFGSGAGLSIGGIVCLVVGVFRMVVSPLEGLATMGVGALLAAAGLLLLLLFAWLVIRWIPELFRSIVNAVRNVRHRNEGGNQI